MWGNKAGNKREIVSEEDNYTFLGTGAKFTGKATFSGPVRINGTLEGELRADDMVIIGEQAVVKGTITCGMIVCKGRVEATVTATHKVQMLKPAVLIGDVYSPSLSMEEGVVFQGQSHMDTSNMDTHAPGAPGDQGSESEGHDARPREQERIDLSPQHAPGTTHTLDSCFRRNDGGGEQGTESATPAPGAPCDQG